MFYCTSSRQLSLKRDRFAFTSYVCKVARQSFFFPLYSSDVRTSKHNLLKCSLLSLTQATNVPHTKSAHTHLCAGANRECKLLNVKSTARKLIASVIKGDAHRDPVDDASETSVLRDRFITAGILERSEINLLCNGFSRFIDS